MKLQLSSIFNALLVATFATQATAFLVPEDLPDGIYSARLDSEGELLAGTEIQLLHTPTPEEISAAANLNSKRSNVPSRIHRRVTLPAHTTLCNHRFFDGNDYLNALNLVSGWQGSYTANNQARFSKWNTAVIYMCSYDPNGSPAWKDEYMPVDGLLNGQCGINIASGYVTIPSWKKHYGRDRAGQKICAGGFQT